MLSLETRKDEELQDYEFDAEDFLNQFQSVQTVQHNTLSFTRVIDSLNKYFEELGTKLGIVYNKKQNLAIRGDSAATDYFIDQIYEFLDLHPDYHGVEIPSPYVSLVDALFHETIGFGPLSAWFRNKTSPAAEVNDVDIIYEIDGEPVEQPYKFSSLDQVNSLITGLTMGHDTATVNRLQPELEIDMYNGIRVSIILPPRSRTNTLVFRKFPMRTFTWQHLSKIGTIGPEAIELFHSLSRLVGVNILFVGAVETGKTTMIKVVFNSRPNRKRVVSVESGMFEIRLRDDFPQRRAYIKEYQAAADALGHFFPKLLRMDAEYIIFPEVRSQEIEALLLSHERGGGYVGSYHNRHLKDIPRQLTELLMNDNPQLNFGVQYDRVASAIEFVVSMRKGEKGRKIVDRVDVYDYDPTTRHLRLVPIVQHVQDTDSWVYANQLPDWLIERARKDTPEDFAHFSAVLQDLASTYPNPNPDIQTKTLRGGL